MSLQVEVNLSLILAIVSLMGTIISSVLFIMRLKWDMGQQEKEILTLKKDVTQLGSKVDKEIDHIGTLLEKEEAEHTIELQKVSNRIDVLEKSVNKVQIQLEYITETLKELREKLFKTAATM